MSSSTKIEYTKEQIALEAEMLNIADGEVDMHAEGITERFCELYLQLKHMYDIIDNLCIIAAIASGESILLLKFMLLEINTDSFNQLSDEIRDYYIKLIIKNIKKNYDRYRMHTFFKFLKTLGNVDIDKYIEFSYTYDEEAGCMKIKDFNFISEIVIDKNIKKLL